MTDKPKSTYIFTVEMYDHLDSYSEEDIVKKMWPYLVPFMTTSNGITKGKIELGDGAIVINWEYSELCNNEDNYYLDYDDYNL